MDFFQSQDNARRNTLLLVVLFVIAVFALVVITNVVVLLVTVAFTPAMQESGRQLMFNDRQFLVVGGIVAGLILLMSWLKILDLAKGGPRVAERLGGRLLSSHGNNLQRRRLLNIVEEMAIASGVPVPPVYLVPDEAINAFAAGYTTGDAVIGITQGALDNLDRAQLQAIVGHEFSHILNGDMRLNIRLMGVVSGLEFVSDFGDAMISANGASVSTRTSSSRRESGHPGFMVLGYLLLAVGSLGRFMGSLIRAAVSRQREFLADASAVQFTRDKVGLRDALRRIGGYEPGSVIRHPVSNEMSHAFFSASVKFRLALLTSTHPPLEVRIRRVDPNWRGSFLRKVPEGQSRATEEEIAMGFVPSLLAAKTVAPDASLLDAWARSKSAPDAGATAAAPDGDPQQGPGPSELGSSLSLMDVDADEVLDDIGHPERRQLDEAQRIIAALTPLLRDAVHDVDGARAAVFAMLLANGADTRSTQAAYLDEALEAEVRANVDLLRPMVLAMEERARMPLAEMAMPALRQLTPAQYRSFIADVDALVRADDRVSLREWALQKFITRHLAEAFEGRHPSARYRRVGEVADECRLLLSMLAHSGKQAGITPQAAFEAGRQELDLELELLPRKSLSLRALNAAVDKLALLRPLQKPRIVKAAIATVTADARVTVVEAELLRAVADALGCPMPPLVADA